MSARADYVAGRITLDEFERRIAETVRAEAEQPLEAAFKERTPPSLEAVDALLKAAYRGPARTETT